MARSRGRSRIRLKYGRKVALARTMARFMAPLLGELPADALLVPVPLHRRRLWQRGFNQSALVGRELSRRLGIGFQRRCASADQADPAAQGHERAASAGARSPARSRSTSSAELRGRTVILVDDVLTTGSTANACAQGLQRAGAARVELVSWARVVRPAQHGHVKGRSRVAKVEIYTKTLLLLLLPGQAAARSRRASSMIEHAIDMDRPPAARK